MIAYIQKYNIMVDYAKIRFININKKQLISQFDDWEKIYRGSKLIEHRLKFHFGFISIKGKTIQFTGSLHKMYNDLKGVFAPNYKKDNYYNGYNGNRFTHSNLLEVGRYLCNVFNCDFYQMGFLTVEFGVNIFLPFKPCLFIKGLLYHLGIPFELKHYRGFAVAIHTESKVKIYDKGRQYKVDDKLLRYELYLKSTKLCKLGIHSFADLISGDFIEVLKSEMIKNLYLLVYYDYTLKGKGLKNGLRRRLEQYKNSNYWLDEVAPNHRYRPKQELGRLIENYSDNLRLQIKKAIEKECVVIKKNCVTKTSISV